MKRILVYWLIIGILSSCVMASSGCSLLFGSSKRSRPKSYTENTNAPERIRIMVKIRDWSVYDHRILSYDPSWGTFSATGRYLYMDSLAVKLRSSKYPANFWLAHVPEVESGEYELTAIRHREHNTEATPVEPPEKITIKIVIRDRKVTQNTIDNPHPGWGSFVVSQYKKGILYLQNPFYPDEVWLAKMPKKNGDWTIYAILQDKAEEK